MSYAIGLTHLTRYDKIGVKSMKLNILRNRYKKSERTIADYKEELLVKQGREQFKKLLEKGITVPVALL